MICPPMDAVERKAAAKQMSRAAPGKKKKKPSHSWMAMVPYCPSSSGKSSGQPPPPAVAAAGDKNAGNEKSGSGGDKKKRSISISRSMACAGSICSTKETSVMNRGAARSSSSRSLRAPNDATAAAVSATSSFNSETTATTVTSSTSPPSSALSSPLSSFRGSFRGVQNRKLAGCYECHSVFDPRSLAGSPFRCADCDEVFVKAESLEFHRATWHAVSELGPEDTSRNVVEIIFQSSWLRKQQAPVCRIDRVLKVQSGDRTVKRFQQYKESIKERASSDEGKKNARCVADGNELLRFHCTTFSCALGAGAGTALCRAPSTQCRLCGIIRDGFRVDGEGKIATMATSGRAHDVAEVSSDGQQKKAMLVCRVVAGRVKRATDTKPSEHSDCDSVSPCSSEGVYSELDELFVFNPRAILPCFVVIYSGY